MIIVVLKIVPRYFYLLIFSGSQNGIVFFDWKGEDVVLNYDFVENGIGIDERCVEGGMVKGMRSTC